MPLLTHAYNGPAFIIRQKCEQGQPANVRYETRLASYCTLALLRFFDKDKLDNYTVSPCRIPIADNCVLASAAADRRHLRSADTMKLLVRRTRTVVGARDFAVSAAAMWNGLPAALRINELPARSRHLRGNWKLSTPARRRSASEDLCALQMHLSSLLLLLLTSIKLGHKASKCWHLMESNSNVGPKYQTLYELHYCRIYDAQKLRPALVRPLYSTSTMSAFVSDTRYSIRPSGDICTIPYSL